MFHGGFSQTSRGAVCPRNGGSFEARLARIPLPPPPPAPARTPRSPVQHSAPFRDMVLGVLCHVPCGHLNSRPLQATFQQSAKGFQCGSVGLSALKTFNRKGGRTGSSNQVIGRRMNGACPDQQRDRDKENGFFAWRRCNPKGIRDRTFMVHDMFPAFFYAY